MQSPLRRDFGNIQVQSSLQLGLISGLSAIQSFGDSSLADVFFDQTNVVVDKFYLRLYLAFRVQPSRWSITPTSELSLFCNLTSSFFRVALESTVFCGNLLVIKPFACMDTLAELITLFDGVHLFIVKSICLESSIVAAGLAVGHQLVFPQMLNQTFFIGSCLFSISCLFTIVLS